MVSSMPPPARMLLDALPVIVVVPKEAPVMPSTSEAMLSPSSAAPPGVGVGAVVGEPVRHGHDQGGGPPVVDDVVRLGSAGDLVGAVRAGDRDPAEVAVLVEPVEPGVAELVVVALPAVEGVALRAAVHRVVAALAVEDVAGDSSRDRVVVAAALERA